MLDYKTKNLIIVSHDAGGANILAAWVKEQNLYNQSKFCLAGPAIKIFEEKFDTLENNHLEIINNEQKNTIVVTATSGKAEQEREAILLSKKNNIPVVSILDHWVNYKKRFTPFHKWSQLEDGSLDFLNMLPDEIWTVDKHAYDLAKEEGFPKEKLVLIENSYFKELEKQLQNTPKSGDFPNYRILFIGQHMKLDKPNLADDKDEITEYTVIRRFLKDIEKYHQKLSAVIRPHPNEDIEKYRSLIEGLDYVSISNSSKVDLHQEIVDSDMVVGISSMALVVGLLAKKKVFSYYKVFPDKKLVIPYKEILGVSSIEDYLSTYL
jgi:hypothetical protein